MSGSSGAMANICDLIVEECEGVSLLGKFLASSVCKYVGALGKPLWPVSRLTYTALDSFQLGTLGAYFKTPAPRHTRNGEQ